MNPKTCLVPSRVPRPRAIQPEHPDEKRAAFWHLF